MTKLLFDLFPLILFFLAFRAFDLYVATGVAMAAVVGQILWLRLRSKPIETRHWINLSVIVVFGGAPLIFQNDAFIKWKPTVLYWRFAAILLGSQWFFRRNLMMPLMGSQIAFPEQAWKKLDDSGAGQLMLSGLTNAVGDFSGYFTDYQWENFKVFVS